MPKAKSSKSKLTAAEKGKYRLQGLIDFGKKGEEKKFYDRTQDETDITGDVAILYQPVLSLAQDTTASTRVGQKIWITSLTLKFTVENPTHGTSYPGPPVTRWDYRLFIDKQTNGVVPTQLLYQQPLGDGGSNTRPYEGLSMFIPNLASAGRFVSLKGGHTKTEINFDHGSETVNRTRAVMSCYYRFPGKGLEIDITNTDGQIGGFKSNNLYVFLQNNAPAGSKWSYKVDSRIRYTD